MEPAEEMIDEIKVTKVWDHGENKGDYPESVTVRLLADGEPVDGKVAVLTEKDGWTAAFEDVPKYNGGVEIKYTVEEDEVKDYGTEITGDVKTGFTITNTYALTPLTVKKVWDDGEDADGIRPESIDVTLTRTDDDKFSETVTLNEGTDWSHTWNVPASDDNVYSVAEDTVPTAYTAEVTGNYESGYTITNKHIPTGIGGGADGHLTVKKEITSPPANGETYALGETITYRITVTNDGEDTVTDITVTDALTGLS